MTTNVLTIPCNDARYFETKEIVIETWDNGVLKETKVLSDLRAYQTYVTDTRQIRVTERAKSAA